MELVFTEYVRSLAPGGGPPDPELFAAMWARLRATLVAEMRRRGLWTAPPGYLGIHPSTSWSDGDALDELLADCYIFILSRLPSLKVHLKSKDSIEGLVLRCVRNFLHDTQKKHDPVGFKVFGALRGAIRQLTTGGTLDVLTGNPRIYNETVLGFVRGGDPVPASGEDLDRCVRGWSGELLPELVTARGQELDAVEQRLAGLVSQLRPQGIEAFRTKDLVDPLKRDVRASWNSIWVEQEGETGIEDGDEEFVEVVRLVRPDSGVEEREAFEKLLACVSDALERLDAPERIRGYHRKLWFFLRSHAAQPGHDELPSQRRIAQQLGIPRQRLAGLYASLRPRVEECQAASSGRLQVIGGTRRQCP